MRIRGKVDVLTNSQSKISELSGNFDSRIGYES